MKTSAEFISINAPMEWNEACSFIRKNDIEGWNGEVAFWSRKDVFKNGAEKDYNEESIKWMRAFFEAHPFMEVVMIV